MKSHPPDDCLTGFIPNHFCQLIHFYQSSQHLYSAYLIFLRGIVKTLIFVAFALEFTTYLECFISGEREVMVPTRQEISVIEKEVLRVTKKMLCCKS